MKKHLLYHITPMGSWRENIEQLQQYAHIFNGKKLAVMAQGPGLESINAVRSELTMFDFIWPRENDAELRETPSLLFLLETLPVVLEEEPDGMSFFAHTKGVTHTENPAVKIWTKMLYEKNLGMVHVVEEWIERYPIIGCFRRFGSFRNLPKGCDWHFSGTFFWLLNSELYARNWKRALKAERYGAEGFPGLLYRAEEAGCLFADNAGSPYKLSYLHTLDHSENPFQRQYLGEWTDDKTRAD